MHKEINEITCHAKNCVYHKGTTSCTAGTIEVGNSTACKCGETQCSTFKLNDNADAQFIGLSERNFDQGADGCLGTALIIERSV